MDEKSVQTLVTSLRLMSEQFHNAVSRCEHCGNAEGFFTCDDCQHNKEQFASAFLDLANVLLPGRDDAGLRMSLMGIAIDPKASQDFVDFYQAFLGEL